MAWLPRAPHARLGSVGVNAALGTDYEFYGVGFSPDTDYLVQITYPDGDSIWPAAATDGSGMWTEFWLGPVSGTYTANVTRGTATSWSPPAASRSPEPSRLNVREGPPRVAGPLSISIGIYGPAGGGFWPGTYAMVTTSDVQVVVASVLLLLPVWNVTTQL